MTGEEIWMISIKGTVCSVPLRLSLATRILADYLARHRFVSQSAAQIEAGISSNPFYAKHASNVGTGTRQTRAVCRSSLKVYLSRLRKALKIASNEAGLMLDPTSVLVTEQTDSNEVLYRLRARVEWRHVPFSQDEFAELP
jgi:hypothetical protein